VRTAAGPWCGVTGDGPPLVLLPGFAAGHAAWAPFVPPLAKRFRLILADLPGVGESSHVSPDGGLEACIGILDDVLDHLGIERTAVLGASLGGLVGLALARARPERVTRVVTAGSMANLNAEARERLGRRLDLLRTAGRDAFAESMVRELVADEFAAAHPRMVAAVVHAYALGLPPDDTVRAIGRLVERVDFRPRLGEVAAPVLVMHGDRDRLVTDRQAAALAEALPRGTLRVFPGAGHHVLLERRRESIEAAVAFLIET
jgi:pimeloyl-ACP methyl ester carboxylesterase